MRKIVILYNLLIIAIFVAVGLINASSPQQSLIALLFIPMGLYFFRELRRNAPRLATLTQAVVLEGATPNHLPTNYSSHQLAQQPANDDQAIIEPELLTNQEIQDINKRLFLKLIGSAGLTMFAFTLFTKKSHAAFFGSMPGPNIIGIKDSSGTTIDPAEKQPTDGYEIANVDDAQIPSYYGFLDKNGNWYITQEDAFGAFRYATGSSGFALAWADRASQSYDTFDNAF